jgi:hypothetical protein
MGDVRKFWDWLVGANLAAVTRPVRIDRTAGVLVVEARERRRRTAALAAQVDAISADDCPVIVDGIPVHRVLDAITHDHLERRARGDDRP